MRVLRFSVCLHPCAVAFFFFLNKSSQMLLAPTGAE